MRLCHRPSAYVCYSLVVNVEAEGLWRMPALLVIMMLSLPSSLPACNGYKGASDSSKTVNRSIFSTTFCDFSVSTRINISLMMLLYIVYARMREKSGMLLNS